MKNQNSLVPVNPFNLIDDFFQRPFEFPSLFDYFPIGYENKSYHFEDGEKELILYLEVPGSEKKDIKTEYDGEYLHVSVDSKTKVRQIKKDYSWNLSDNYDGEKINAELKDGILKITIPKKENKIKRLIEIK